MLHRLAKVVALAAVLCGLCPPTEANTTASSAFAREAPVQLAQNDISIHRDVPVPAAAALKLEPVVRVALLLPLQSEALHSAAEALRAGFFAAYEQEQDGIDVTVVETSEVPQDILAAYIDASAQHDVVVGPMTRSGATAVAQSGEVHKPTIALTQPDSAGVGLKPPGQFIVIGLSIEDEARQLAAWAGAGKSAARALIVSSNIAWQQRAADAFAGQWQKQGRELQAIELPAFSGYLAAHDVEQLKTELEFDKPDLIFAALDERQAKQLRAAIGNRIPLYGTSQLNEAASSDPAAASRTDMNGIRLLDIPWQLQADDPAVMAYPRPVATSDQRRSADIDRLYALGIDAYRVTREIAMKHNDFELDGVTGKLTVRFDAPAPYFERVQQQAVYRDGSVVAVTLPR